MVEIIVRNGVSIQTFKTTDTSIVTATIDSQDITLNRAGAFLGCEVANFINAASIGAACHITTAVTKTDDTTLAYGDQITAIRVKVRNDSGGNRTVGTHLVVYIGV